MAQAQAPQESAEPPAFVAGAVIGHDPTEAYAQRTVVTQCLQQCAARAGATSVVLDGGEGDPGVIVNCQVDELPACAVGRALAIVRDPMARAPEPAQLLDVQVQQVAGARVFVAVIGARRAGSSLASRCSLAQRISRAIVLSPTGKASAI